VFYVTIYEEKIILRSREKDRVHINIMHTLFNAACTSDGNGNIIWVTLLKHLHNKYTPTTDKTFLSSLS
jgi:hypothetical protein